MIITIYRMRLSDNSNILIVAFVVPQSKNLLLTVAAVRVSSEVACNNSQALYKLRVKILILKDSALYYMVGGFGLLCT